MEASPQIAPLGDNSAKVPLKEVLADSNRALTQERDLALGSAGRAPDIIKNDDQLLGVGKLVVRLRDIVAKARAAHKTEKQPFLDGGREVDTFFNAGIIAACEEMAGTLVRRQNAYNMAKEQALREQAAREAAKAREEEDERLRQARHAEDHGEIGEASTMLDEAVAASTKAATAEAMQSAPSADLLRVRSGAGGGVAVTAKAVWVGEVTDLNALDFAKLRPFFKPEHIKYAVDAAVKFGVREIAGVKITETKATINKRG